MKWMPIFFLLVLVAGATLRLPHLADRPMHHDEANQAYRFGALLEDGTYTYDADDHHGPTLYYLTLPIAWLTGAKTFAETTETTYRTLPVIFGLVLILCLLLLRRSIGSIAVLAAALFTAVSPAMAYYSRFYIQEISLVFFTFIAIAAGWRSITNGSRGWAVICGLSLGLMFATKETAVIAYAALFGSGLLCALCDRNTNLPLKNMLIAAGCAIVISFVLFSSFFTNLDGPAESIAAFKGYFARGSGIDTDHVHPWNYYLGMLIQTEGLVFSLGWVGIISILWKKIPTQCNSGLARFLMFYTLLLTLAYSVIAYKTPWCILSFLHGWILLAGIGVATIFRAAQRGRMPRLQSAAVLALLLVPALGTFRLAHRTVFRYAADPRNPYVYAHTAPDFMNLVRRIGELEAVSPKGKAMYIQVVADPKETWPIPFYLRGFPNTGYWVEPSAVPNESQPDLMISSADFDIEPVGYLTEYYGLRTDTLLAIHIRLDLWNRFMGTRRPEFDLSSARSLPADPARGSR